MTLFYQILMNAAVEPTIAMKMLFVPIYWEIFHVSVNPDLLAAESIALVILIYK